MRNREERRSAWEWVPAPGWPRPPARWVPPPGWSPDRSWPPPPPGWNGWRRTKAGRRRRGLLVGLLVVLVPVGCGTLVGAETVAEHQGHSIDPTDAMNYDQFRLENDTTGRLYIRACDDNACRRFTPELEWTPVEPGAREPEQVYWGAAQPVLYAVSSAASLDGLRGCLALDARQKTTAVTTVQLSALRPCPASGGS